MGKDKYIVGGLLLVLIILLGEIRIYNGSNMSVRVVKKASFSYVDTYVNLDDLLGMPRIALASQHPAVKNKLEKMGVIKTDDQIMEEVNAKVQETMRESMEQSQMIMKASMEEYQRLMDSIQNR